MNSGKVMKLFGSALIHPNIIFYETNLTFAFVNRKPVVPGHVLISPKRVVHRFYQLTDGEVSDLFLVTKLMAEKLEKFYCATSLTINIQDGVDAGQTIPHVHVHLLPRKKGDFLNNDEVYKHLNEHDKIPFEEDEANFRSEEEMAMEALLLKSLFN